MKKSLPFTTKNFRLLWHEKFCIYSEKNVGCSQGFYSCLSQVNGMLVISTLDLKPNFLGCIQIISLGLKLASNALPNWFDMIKPWNAWKQNSKY